jgi:hypothetical protein
VFRFSLLITALIVFVPIAVFGMFYHFISGGGGNYFLSTSSSLSQSCNAFSGKFLNKIFIKKGMPFSSFGNRDESISGVLGKNSELNSLSAMGRLVRKTLNKLESSHTETAIERDE